MQEIYLLKPCVFDSLAANGIFDMLLTQLDMPAARYVCFANEGFISYRVGEVHISTEEKREQEYKEKILIFLLSFCLYISLGLSYFAFQNGVANFLEMWYNNKE